MPHLTTDAYGARWLLPGEAVTLLAYTDGPGAKPLRVAWSSRDDAVARVELAGDRARLLAVAPGVVTVEARFDDGTTGQKEFEVLDATRARWVRFELQQQGHAPGRFSFAATAGFAEKVERDVTSHAGLEWTTSTPGVASWDGPPGILTAHGEGDVVVGLRGLGHEKTLQLHVAGGVAACIDALLHFDRVLPVGLRYRFGLQVHRTDERFRQASAPGLEVDVHPAGVLEVDRTPGAERMVGLRPGTAEVTARLGAQSLTTAVEVVDAPITLEPIHVNGETYRVGGGPETFTFVGKALELSTRLSWAKGSLDEDLNLEWASSAPEVLRVQREQGVPVARALAPGTATLEVRCPARGVSQQCTVVVVEPPDIQWF